MKHKPSPRQHHPLLKIGYFVAGMVLSATITNIIDRFFPPEPVVVHTVIDSVKIVYEHRQRELTRKRMESNRKTTYENTDKQP